MKKNKLIFLRHFPLQLKSKTFFPRFCWQIVFLLVFPSCQSFLFDCNTPPILFFFSFFALTAAFFLSVGDYQQSAIHIIIAIVSVVFVVIIVIMTMLMMREEDCLCYDKTIGCCVFFSALPVLFLLCLYCCLSCIFLRRNLFFPFTFPLIISTLCHGLVIFHFAVVVVSAILVVINYLLQKR